MADPVLPTVRTDEMFRSLEAQLINKTEDARKATEGLALATSRADEFEAAAKTLKAQIPVLQAQLQQSQAASETVEIVKQKTRADAAETAFTALKASWGEAIRNRVALERRCAPCHPVGYRMDSLEDDTLMRATLKRLDAQADISASVTTDSIKGALTIRLDEFEAHARSKGLIAEVLHTQKVETPKDRHDEAQKERWRKPLPNSVHAVAGMKR